MKDTELYRHLLGVVEPWTVDRVELNAKDRQVDVWAGHPDQVRWPCPKCGQLLPVFDHAEERVWRHLDSCHFRTFLHARVPWVECPKDGRIQVKVPWAESNARFTALFERLAIDVMQEMSVTGAADFLGVSWDEA